MKNDELKQIRKRVIGTGAVLFLFLIALDRYKFKTTVESEKNKIILESLASHKRLTDDIGILFNRVQNDFSFFERVLPNLVSLNEKSQRYQAEVHLLLNFLDTHEGYFKVRLINSKGGEVFKIIQNIDQNNYHQSHELFDLSGQKFYQDLSTVRENEFFISLMEANIINGVVESPLRPTIRIARKVKLKNNEFGLLVFNIDGNRVLNFFQSKESPAISVSKKILLGAGGVYVASYPVLDKEVYVFKKKSLHEVYQKLIAINNIQGVVDIPGERIIYSKVVLPNIHEKWILVTKIDDTVWKSAVQKQHLTWIFWELLLFVILLFLIWKNELKRYKDEVSKVLLNERTEFGYNVSHQLKTPLAILLNTLHKPELSMIDWEEVKKEVKHLIKVVEDMLLLSLVESSKNIHLQQENILEALIESVEMSGRKAKDKEISVRLNVEERFHEMPEVFERPLMKDLFISALMNIIDNALDFSPRKESVNIFVLFRNNKIVIQIKDNGPGIPEDLVSKLFTPFVRENKTGRKGSGLGLAITKKIIELHCGEVRIADYKSGSTFEISL